MLIHIYSSEQQIQESLGLIFQGRGKETDTMHDITNYSRIFVHKNDNKNTIGIYGNLYVTFFTNNKGERCYKYYHEVELYNFITHQSIYIYKKTQVEPSNVLTWNDSININNTLDKLTNIVNNEFNKLNIK